MRKATAIIQARMGASRLPGKVLFKLEGKTVLEHVVERVRKSRMIRQAVVATSVNNRDLKIVSLCRKKKIPVFCGSEEDCLERFYRAAKCFQAEHIVRITSDCPLLDYKIINKVINLYFSKKADYATNTMR